MTTSKPTSNPMNLIGKWVYTGDHINNMCLIFKVIKITDKTVLFGNPKIDIYDITDLDEDSLIKRSANMETVEYEICNQEKKWLGGWHYLIPQPAKLYYFRSGPEMAVLKHMIRFEDLKVFSSLREIVSDMFGPVFVPVCGRKLNMLVNDYIKRKNQAKTEMIRCLVKKSSLPVELKKMITEWM